MRQCLIIGFLGLILTGCGTTQTLNTYDTNIKIYANNNTNGTNYWPETKPLNLPVGKKTHEI